MSAPKENLLKDLDYSVLQQCIHCGMCLPTCPTYDATLHEASSPRGRIALMRAIADDRIEATKGFADEIYFCLGCLACMTACPAGVNYEHMFELGRAQAERSGVLSSPRRNGIRKLILRWLFMSRNRLRFLARLLRLYQQTGLQKLIRKSGLLRLLPKNLRELEPLTPGISPRFTSIPYRTPSPEKTMPRRKVAVLAGCVQDLSFAEVNRDTIEVLEANNCEVILPAGQQCCGSLHAHNGELDMARELARINLDSFPLDECEAIIINAAGCGSHMRHYDRLLKGDPLYEERAGKWSSKVRDIHEYLSEIEFRPPSPSKPGSKEKTRVTYHEACHLVHGQKISKQPRSILASLPNVEMVELPEATWCCGSAGIYNITQPEMAAQLQERKIKHILSTGASVVATANPGCIVQIIAGLRKGNTPIRIVHPITLLAEAYRAGGNSGNQKPTKITPLNAASR